MVIILRKVVVPGWPRKHAEDYTCMHVYNNHYSASHFTLQVHRHVGQVNLRTLTHCLQSWTVSLNQR